MVSKANTDYTRYSSWGRTRQPKNLAGAHGTECTTSVATAAPSSATDGFPTENQRYLHLLLDTDTDNSTNVVITVWAYSHAFGTWGTLTGVGGAVTITINDGKKHGVFEISGVDRVYFQSTGSTVFGATGTGADKLFAACSTF